MKGVTVRLNAVANGAVQLGLVKDIFSLGTGESIATLMPVVPAGIDTTIYDNYPQVMIFNLSGNPTLYVKTYKVATNTPLDLYAIVTK